ncbi:circularly permuted type 2 ATP-grasp protein [Amaricoccus sp. W119]|uniref:circularly permuted type 2 ATP-grasp protein n=1 Tax=Amaricoccus sp. W119 TaxID=3391833 RepID=UPI0039A5B0C4
MRSREALAPDDAIAGLLADYRPLPGVADELLDQTGHIRPVWSQFMRHLAAISPEDLTGRFAQGDQYLRDAGVFFRQYGDTLSTERAWPLSHIPVLIEEAEWNGIAEGLIQRADLLEAVVADLYGPNRLVGTGQLPGSLIARSAEWLRPLVGVQPRSGHYLHFLAFELGRGPDGTWWVLGDRTQAPSGAGFALENRMATARVFSELYAESNAHRLAGFFRTFRDALQRLCDDRDPRVAIMTPGQLNDTYFEHAYIARYLGFLLLEGEDLTVEQGRVMVRTVAGPKPIGVLWRRLDAAFADPLELNPGSRIGTPGLVSAVRKGNVSLVNALGSGILETRALLAFLPRISMALRGEALRLPNIATWWCGQPVERAHVRANAARMMIGAALSTRLPFDLDGSTFLGGGHAGRTREEIDAWIESEASGLVGQEAVTLSTTPAHVDGKLVPRPISLRAFVARTDRGWQVMPGGFARIGRTPDPTAIAMQRGGSAADVWIVGPAPVINVSMLPESGSGLRLRQGALPSRAADNLFWLGRYIERAEGMMRLIRAHHIRLAETGDAEAPLLAYLDLHLSDVGVDPAEEIPEGLRATLGAATMSASHVRDRFSTDGWMALNDLSRTARKMAGTARAGDDCARAMGVLLRKLTGFSGLVHENMYRFTGWRFLAIGRAMERAMEMAGLLAWLGAPEAPEGALDMAIEIGDSVMTHLRRYAVATTRETVMDLLALDGRNPRSILYQMTEIRDQVALLPVAETGGQLSRLSREVMRAHTEIATELPETLDTEALLACRSRLFDLSNLLSESYLG